MDTYSVTQVARFLSVSVGTVRADGREFADFLSAAANPGPGQERRFNDDDLSVFQTVRVLRGRNLTLDQVLAELQKGTRLEPAEAPTEPPRGRRRDETPEGVQLELANQLKAVIAKFEGELEATKSERDRLIMERDREREKAESHAAAVLDAEKRAAAAEARAQFLATQLEEVRNAAASPPTHTVIPDRRNWIVRLFGQKQ